MKNRLDRFFKEPPVKRPPDGHYSVGLIVKKGPDCEPLVLVYKKRNKGTKKWVFRLPGSRQKRGETHISTLLRACREKLGVPSFDAFRWTKVHTVNRIISGEEHLQVVFLHSVSGNQDDLSFRKEVKEVLHERTGIMEEWGPPEWMPISKALDKLLYTHRSHLMLSLNHIKKMRPCFGKYIDFNKNEIVASPHPKWLSWVKFPRLCMHN